MFTMTVRLLKSPLAAAALLSFFPVLFPAATGTVRGQAPEAADSVAPLVEFEENLGQFPDQVRYLARTAGMNLFVTSNEAVYVMPIRCEAGDPKCGDENDPKQPSMAFALRMKLIGANSGSVKRGEMRTEHRTNYLKGQPEEFVTGVPNFTRVRMSGIYEGIDMIWHGLENGATRYDFEIRPGADPSQIALEFQGAERIELDGEGNLVISTPAGSMKHAKPVTYQESDGLRAEVSSRFRIDGARVSFDLGDYDRSKTLTIDPTVALNNLVYSSFLGSFGDDAANDIAVDSNGNSYVTGRSTSITFPTTAGTFDTSANGLEDAYVAKFNSSGSGLVFSTYLGGAFYDEGNGIAVDALGDIYLTGSTSSGFPTTVGAYDTTFNGGADVFVARLASNGASLVYSTYIGTSQIDVANDLALDPSGNAYIVVRTPDSIVDFPTTAGAFDTTHNGSDDVAVAKINPTGSALVYSTFLGGSAIDSGASIAVNAAGEAYVCGSTTDDVVDFPTTAGAYDTTVNGVTDYFLTRVNSAGSGLIYSTVIGGPGIDNPNAVAIDAAGNAYIGGTASTGFPTTAGVLDTTVLGGSEAAIAKVSAEGTMLLYSTFLGGTQSESIRGIAVDQLGNAFVTGENFGGDFPTTPGAYDTTANGSSDAFFSVVNQNASALAYSTYLGGGGTDFGNDIAIDQIGNVYLTGRTAASGAAFPTNNEAFQSFNGGGNDAFVTKFGDFVIGGKVIDATTGNPVSNVMVALSGQVSGFVITGADGRFGFLDTVPGEPHAVTATRAGYAINPAVFNISSLAANRELVFVATVGSPTGGSGGTLRFEGISYSKAENGGSVTATVKRIGDIQTVDPVTVDFTTSNGTAVAGQDFQPTNGVITFNALETTKTVTIPILNDGILEPRESFSIELSNPTNNSEIEPNRGSTTVQILDEDLANGDLLISEFRQRGRLGARDEYVKLFNPNGFDVTVQTADGSGGIAVAHSDNNGLTAVATIPNQVTIGARGYYMLTNNDPAGGFSLIDYPTGRGTTTAVGDRTFVSDIPDNSSIVLMRTSDPASFISANALDAVGFDGSPWAEGKPLPALASQSSEMSYVRRLSQDGFKDSGNNGADFVLVDNRATVFEGIDQTKRGATLGAPAPGTSESLPLLAPAAVTIAEAGFETYDPSPVSNGPQGTLTVYRAITNNSGNPLTALRLRAVDFPTSGGALSKRYSSRPDFRLASSQPEGDSIFAATLAAERLQPNGGGINSTLEIGAVSGSNPLMPGESIVVAIRLTVVRFGRHPLTLAAEGN